MVPVEGKPVPWHCVHTKALRGGGHRQGHALLDATPTPLLRKERLDEKTWPQALSPQAPHCQSDDSLCISARPRISPKKHGHRGSRVKCLRGLGQHSHPNMKVSAAGAMVLKPPADSTLAY